VTQFASTLYPQKNPTNPILLAFRTVYRKEAAGLMIHGMAFRIQRGDWNEVTTTRQRRHAALVLKRLAALTG